LAIDCCSSVSRPLAAVSLVVDCNSLSLLLQKFT
jgi:hypothetical protein